MRKIVISIAALVLIIGLLVVKQFFVVMRAHSTFENYYAFRDCTKLLKRTSTYGICKTPGGQTIKIIAFRGKWYLDGDLPNCVGNVCW